MPIVYVVDPAPDYDVGDHFDYEKAIQECFAEVSELKLTVDDVIVKFIETHQFRPDPPRSTIVTVYGLVDKPERTKEVRQKLAGKIRTAIKKHSFDSLKHLLVFVPVFDEKQGGLAGIGED